MAGYLDQGQTSLNGLEELSVRLGLLMSFLILFFFFHISEVYGFSNHRFQTPASRPGWKHRFGKETHRH